LGETPFEQVLARVAVLPARVVYLVAAGSRMGFRRAAQEASCRWAGMTELIVPVRARGGIDRAWVQMIGYGSYDCLVNVDAADGAAERAQRELDLPLVSLRDIDRWSPSSWSIHPVNIAEQHPWASAAVMATSREAPLWEIAAAGDLTERHELEVEGHGFGRRPSTDDGVGRAQLAGETLLDRGLEQFREHLATGGPYPSPTVLRVTKPNSIADCTWYWNCRALRPLEFENFPMVLLPHQGVEHWVGFADQLITMLQRTEDIEPDVVLCSVSIEPEELRSIARLFGLRASRKKIRRSRIFPPPPARAAPFTFKLNTDPRAFVMFERQYGITADTVIHTGPSRTLLRVESPVRFSGGGRVLLRITSSGFDHLPRVDALADRMLGGADWAPSGALQVRTNAGPRYHLELQIPDMDEATWAVLNAVAAEARLSDKGRLAHRVAARSTSPVVLTPGAVEMVAELTTPRSKELLRELRRLRSDGHSDADLAEVAAAWGGRPQRRFRSVKDFQGGHDVAEVLATEGWAERGMGIRCEQCLIRSFVPLRDAESVPLCPACEAVQSFEGSKALGPSLCYRLNGLVDRASDQGVLPHLLAAAALEKRDPRTYLLMGVDVRFSDGHSAEVDLFGLHGGRIVAGEAKTSPAEFSIDQLQRDVDLSVRLGARAHLVACPRSLDDEHLARAARLVSPTGMDLLVIEGPDVRQIDTSGGGSLATI
jgi:hypothetical protein